MIGPRARPTTAPRPLCHRLHALPVRRRADERGEEVGLDGLDSARLSACHCTPTTNRAVGSSTVSMTPSGAQPTGRRPLPRRSIAWWWKELTSISVAPAIRAMREPSARRTACVGTLPASSWRWRARRALAGQVLHEGAAARHVQRLHAAADGEDRQARVARPRARAPARTRRSPARSARARGAAPGRRSLGAGRGRPVSSRPSSRATSRSMTSGSSGGRITGIAPARSSDCG